MRRNMVATAIALACAVSIACGDGGNAPNRSEFAGTWDGTKLEFTRVGNPSQAVDVVAAGGTLVAVLDEGGTYQWTVTPAGGAPETSSGTWSASADVFTIRETGMSGEMQFDWRMSGGTLSLSGADGDYDFNDDGTPEDAKVSAVLVRR